MRNRTEIRVFLSSPEDCRPEKEAVRRVINELNQTFAASMGFFFQVFDWKELAPGGGVPQYVIDQQLGDYDILIGLMWHRHGTPLPGSSSSGTEHEVEQALKRWRRLGQPRVMFYFKRKSPPLLDSIEPEQLKRMERFRRHLERIALVQSFEEIEELESRLRAHLHRVLTFYLEQTRVTPADESETEYFVSSRDSTGHPRRFVHGPVAQGDFLGASSSENPYLEVIETERLKRSPQEFRVFLVPNLPAPEYLRHEPPSSLTAFCCICVALPDEYLEKVFTGVSEDLMSVLLTKHPSKIRNDSKKELIRSMAGVLEGGFIATGTFGDFVQKAGKGRPEVAYQVIMDAFLLPLLTLHWDIGFRRSLVMIPNLGKQTKVVLKVAKRATRAVFSEPASAGVAVIRDGSGWMVAQKFARFVDWAVGAAYRGKSRKWLELLEREFG